ncbi:MAG: flippase [Lachnospiraceae bacterium]|nr:flippase [Lachnospiraceae bacterium]
MAKNLVHNVMAKGVLNIFNTLLPLVITPYVYHLLGPEGMGNIEYATVLFGYFGMLGMLGIYNYGLREISAHRNDIAKRNSIFKNLFAIGILSNMFFLGVYILFIHFCLTTPELKIISYILCGNLVSQIFYIEWLNEALEEFKFITVKTVIIRSISLIFIFLFVRSVSDAVIYVCITVVVQFVNYIVSFVYGIRNIKFRIKDLFHGLDMKPYIVPLLMILVLNNTGILYTIADRTILGHFTNLENVAYFSIGQRIVELTKTLLLSVVFATLPRFALYLNEDREKYQEGILKVIRLLLFIIVPAGIGLFMLSDSLIWIFGGSQYLKGVDAMRVFSLRIILLGVDAVLYNQIIFLHGKERVLVKYNLICGGINLVLNFLFISILTPFISILCTLASEIVFEILCLSYIKRNLKVKVGIFQWTTYRYILVSLLFIPIVLGINMLDIDRIVKVIMSVVTCITVYMATMQVIHDQAYEQIKEYSMKLFKR